MTYEVKYNFSFKETPPVNDALFEVDVLYDAKCQAEIPISTNVEPHILNAARLDFIDEHGMLAPFCLQCFAIVDFVKKN